MLAEHRLQLLDRRAGLLILGNPTTHPDHVRERPICDALAIGETTTAVPVGDLGQPVHVLEELPCQPGLADTCDPDKRDEMGSALVDDAVKELLDESQLPIAADEWRLEALGLQRAASTGHNTECARKRVETALALLLVRAGSRVGERLRRRAPGRVADVDRPWRGDRLNPRRCVDEVAGHHPLPLGSERDGRLSGQYPGTSP